MITNNYTATFFGSQCIWQIQCGRLPEKP